MEIFDTQGFDQFRSEKELFYKNLGEVYCPYFKEKIIFNARGLEHLKFKTKNHARPVNDQIMRFRLIHLAPEVLSLSRTIQGISRTRNLEYIRTNARTEQILKEVSYYEFIAILDDKQGKKRVRVVVKQIENAPKYFWSIIPFWKVNRKTLERKMNSGDLEIR